MPGDDLKRARDRCYRLLACRSLTEQQLKCRLERAGFSTLIIDTVIAELKVKKLLDDESFARNWVHRRLSTKPVGAGYLWAELQQKGVDRDIIAGALRGYDQDCEYDAAMQLAHKKLAAMGTEINWRRLAGYLTRRGFSCSVLRKVHRSVTEDGRFELS